MRSMATGLGWLIFSSFATVAACGGESEQTFVSEHFLLHIPDFIPDVSTDQAEELLALLERVFAYHLAREFDPLPPDDGVGGDDRQDVYLVNDGGNGKPTRLEMPIDNREIAAHELHHVFQVVALGAEGLGTGVANRWLTESTAQWMGAAPFLSHPDAVPVDEEVLNYLGATLVHGYFLNPELGLLEDAGNFETVHPGYDRWILWHYLDSIDTEILRRVYGKIARLADGNTFEVLDQALWELTEGGLADHLLAMAAWWLRFQELSGVQLVRRDLALDQDLVVEGVQCLGYTAARIEPYIGQVRATVRGGDAVGAAVVSVHPDGNTRVEATYGSGVVEVIGNLPADAVSFVISANLKFGRAPCDATADLHIVVSAQ